MAMALHKSEEYEVAVLDPAHPVAEAVVEYSGRGVALTWQLCEVAHGGQVVLSDQAWQGVKCIMVDHPGKWSPGSA